MSYTNAEIQKIQRGKNPTQQTIQKGQSLTWECFNKNRKQGPAGRQRETRSAKETMQRQNQYNRFT